MPAPTYAQPVRVSAAHLRTFVTRVLENLDVPTAQATAVAEVMVSANLRGVDSHGVALLGWYVNNLVKGAVLKNGSPLIEAEGPSYAIINGGNALGPYAALTATDKCLELAWTNGLACVTVHNSNHLGMTGYYAMRALSKDMIGVAMTNASRLIAPTFGVEPMLGTNPIAVAVPSGSQYPFVLDMATSTWPYGKVMMAKHKNQQLPEGIAINAAGQPIQNPDEFIEAVRVNFDGALLPLGSFAELASYKGYGLAMLVDILSGVLSGSNFGKDVGAKPEGPANVGHWFMVIKVDSFMPIDQMKARMDSLITELKASRKAPGQDRIYIPGEIEFETEKERSQIGIPLAPGILSALRSVAEQSGALFDLEFG